jgi:DNA-binding NarL/FixJ family response regulator
VASPRIVVLADDLIWSTRLAGHLRDAGAVPVPARNVAAFASALDGADGAIVDLTAVAYDGVSALEQARAARVRALAVGQHDDIALRKRALAAGAERVYAYRKLFESGPATLTAWLGAGSGSSR